MNQRDEESSPSYTQSPSRRNRNKGRRHHSHRGHGRHPQTFETYEEQQKKHLQWMVRNTASILGEDAPTPGQMSQQTIDTCYSLMQAWAQRAGTVQSSKAPHVIEALLKRLLLEKNALKEARRQKIKNALSPNKENVGDGDKKSVHDMKSERHQVKIDTDVYDAVLAGWANSREKGSAERAEEILLQMEQSKGLKPTARSYNAVLKAFVKNGDRQIAAQKANTLITKMETSNDATVLPNVRSYNLFLYALAHAPAGSFEDSADTALAVLRRMLERYDVEKDDCKARPNTNSFNQVIKAFAKDKSPNFERIMEDVYGLMLERSEDLGIEPDRDTYNAMMGGWLNSEDPGALAKIQTIFADMEESFENGNNSARPDRISINTLQVALNRHSRSNDNIRKKIVGLERKYHLCITGESQNMKMNSIIQSGVEDAPEKVMEMLTRMEEDYRNGYEEMKPDQCSYSSVIQAYTGYKRPDLGDVADDLLSRMWELHRLYDADAPDVDMYNNVVNAFASLQSWGAIGRVKQLLHEMESEAKYEVPRPNLKTYNTVMKAMRSRNEEEGAVFAEHILLTLENIGERDAAFMPDAYSYASVITAYARSKSPAKAAKALEIVHRMRAACDKGNSSACITILALNAALNACAFADGNPEERAKAFDIALKLDAVRRSLSIKPDNTWYGTMLRACSFLLKPSLERERYVEQFFEEACYEGCVGKLVLAQLKFAATANQYERLLGRSPEERTYLRDLPREWTCNGRDTRPAFRHAARV
ncbi:MAG: hypothetical protein SGILL_004870 [Bacillariaceae sp.]